MGANPHGGWLTNREERERAVDSKERRERRKERLEALQKLRGSDLLIAYITSTRPGISHPMTDEAFRRFYEHMPNQKVRQIDLFIHSDGGDGVVPWRLMSLLREYSEHVDVLVPYRAFSAATLTALGAKNIVMHPMGMLGPIDPTVLDPFGPIDPSTGKPYGVSVEDVAAYIALVKEDVGIRHEDELVRAFTHLAKQASPLTLGNVKRATAQARMLGEKLLRLRDPQAEAHSIEQIVEQLTTKLYYHGHPINRCEAKDDLGLHVEYPEPSVETAMWSLYTAYEEDMDLDREFDLINESLRANPNASFKQGEWTSFDLQPIILSIIESSRRADVYEQDLRINMTENDNGWLSATGMPLRSAWSVQS
jgi:hypothetical protein